MNDDADLETVLQQAGEPFVFAREGVSDLQWYAWMPGMKISVRTHPEDVLMQAHGQDKITFTGRFIDIFANMMGRVPMAKKATLLEDMSGIASFMAHLRPEGFLPPATLTIENQSDNQIKLSLEFL